MAYQMLTPFLILAMWILAGVVHSAETSLASNHINEVRSVGIGQSSWDDSNPKYTIQAGYEGYLVPVESQSVKEIIKTLGIFGAIPILSKYMGVVALKMGVALAVVVFLGLLLNLGLCKCTSLCPLDINPSWDRSFSVSQDQVQSAARLLATAVDKYAQDQQKAS